MFMEIYVIIQFVKVFVFIFSLLIVAKEAVRLIKCIKTQTQFEILSRDLLYLGVSVSYALTVMLV